MSLNIQNAPADSAAIAAPGAVLPVPLSERVQARQPNASGQPPQQTLYEQGPEYVQQDATLRPIEREEVETPDQAASNVAREVMRRDPNQMEPRPPRDPLLSKQPGKGGQAAVVVNMRPGDAGQPAAAGGRPTPVAAPLPGGDAAATVTAPAAGAPSAAAPNATTGGVIPVGTHPAGGADTPSTPAPAGAAPASVTATASAPAALRVTRTAGSAMAPSAAPAAGASIAPGQPGAATAPPAPTREPGAASDGINTPTLTTASAEQRGADSSSDGQSLADARRAQANLGTRKLASAARHAEALNAAMAQRAEASQIHVSFNSWGAGHSVTASLNGGRLQMQASSARVGQALSGAAAPAGTDLQIAVDSTDSATDERGQRRGSQGHA